LPLAPPSWSSMCPLATTASGQPSVIEIFKAQQPQPYPRKAGRPPWGEPRCVVNETSPGARLPNRPVLFTLSGEVSWERTFRAGRRRRMSSAALDAHLVTGPIAGLGAPSIQQRVVRPRRSPKVGVRKRGAVRVLKQEECGFPGVVGDVTRVPGLLFFFFSPCARVPFYVSPRQTPRSRGRSDATRCRRPRVSRGPSKLERLPRLRK